LLCRGLFQRPGGHTAGGGKGDLLHLSQIDIQPRSLSAEGAANDDFSPALGELRNAIQVLGCQLS